MKFTRITYPIWRERFWVKLDFLPGTPDPILSTPSSEVDSYKTELKTTASWIHWLKAVRTYFLKINYRRTMIYIILSKIQSNFIGNRFRRTKVTLEMFILPVSLLPVCSCSKCFESSGNFNRNRSLNTAMSMDKPRKLFAK